MDMQKVQFIIVSAIPLFFTLMAIEIVYNYFTHKNNYSAKDSMANLGAGILSQLAGFLLKPLKILVYSWFFYHFNIDKALEIGLWSTDLATTNGVFTWVFGFFMIDMLYYWYHRHAHELNILWACHVVHHSSEEYNLSVALRQSSFQGFLSIPYYIPAAILGIDPVIYVASYALNLIYQFWVHTRFIPKLGPLELVLSTPSHHRVHHARQMKYLDKNYGGVLIIWDKLFGTFKEEEEEPIYGIFPRFSSYNAVTANIQPFKELIHYFLKANSIKHKFLVLFGSPMWLYENYKKGQLRPVKWKKNNITPTTGWIGFVATLLVALYLLNNARNLDTLAIIGLSTFVALCLYNLGILLDRVKVSNDLS